MQGALSSICFDSQKMQMMAIRKAEREKVMSILTPDQRARFEAMKASHAEHEKNEQK